jgi:hypothetical protein
MPQPATSTADRLMVGRVARSGRMSESARAWEGNAVPLGSGGDQRRSRLAGVAPHLEQVTSAQPTIGRFARSIWRACMRMNSSAPIDCPPPIPIQAPSPMSGSATTRLNSQTARATSSPSPAAATQRHSGAVSVACARPTAMAATRGSGWPNPRHAHWTTSRRVRRSSPRQARTACLPRGTSTFASPITLRDSRPRPLPRTIPNLASPAAPPQSDRSFPQHAGTRAGLWRPEGRRPRSCPSRGLRRRESPPAAASDAWRAAEPFSAVGAYPSRTPREWADGAQGSVWASRVLSLEGPRARRRLLLSPGRL